TTLHATTPKMPTQQHHSAPERLNHQFDAKSRLKAAASNSERAAAQARTAVNAFEAVRAAAIHPKMVAANRNQFVSLVLSNFFGQNAPLIAATEAAYEQMWAQDVAAMVGYHAGASAVVSALEPFVQPLQGLAGLRTQIAAAPAAAAASAAAPARMLAIQLGVANVGVGNVGNGNVGLLNFGSGNRLFAVEGVGRSTVFGR
ncbi:PPE family protein, partial [Mycobacterium bourgelatii]